MSNGRNVLDAIRMICINGQNQDHTLVEVRHLCIIEKKHTKSGQK